MGSLVEGAYVVTNQSFQQRFIQSFSTELMHKIHPRLFEAYIFDSKHFDAAFLIKIHSKNHFCSNQI